MKKLSLILAASVALSGLMYAANSTTMGSPGNAGRPQADTTTNARIYQFFNRSIADCSASAQLVPLSNTSSVVNLTTTAGLNFVTNGYTGAFRVHFVNVGNSSMVAWPSMTAATIPGITPAGVVVAAGASGFLDVQARDGVTVHYQGLTNTTTVNSNVCTY